SRGAPAPEGDSPQLRPPPDWRQTPAPAHPPGRGVAAGRRAPSSRPRGTRGADAKRSRIGTRACRARAPLVRLEGRHPAPRLLLEQVLVGPLIEDGIEFLLRHVVVGQVRRDVLLGIFAVELLHEVEALLARHRTAADVVADL